MSALAGVVNEQDPVSHSRPTSLKASYLTSVSVTHKKIYIADTPTQYPITQTIEQNLNPVHTIQPKPDLVSRKRAQQLRTPPTYPFLAYSTVKEPKRNTTGYPHSVGQQA
jgi:hypothetical protein